MDMAWMVPLKHVKKIDCIDEQWRLVVNNFARKVHYGGGVLCIILSVDDRKS